MLSFIKEIYSKPSCVKCSSSTKPINFLPVKGWKCTSCKGIFAKAKHIYFQKEFLEQITKAKVSKSEHKCAKCKESLSLLKIQNPQLEIEYCETDKMVFFDHQEDDTFMNFYADQAITPVNNQRDHFGYGDLSAGRRILDMKVAERHANGDPEKIKAIVDEMNEHMKL